MPNGWSLVRLSDIAEVKKQAFDVATLGDQRVRHFSIPAFDAGSPVVEAASQIKSGKLEFESEDILFSKLNPLTPRVWWPKPDSMLRNLASTEFVPFRAKPHVDPGFLYQVLRSPSILAVARAKVTGTTGSHQRVDIDSLLAAKLLLPDLKTQKEIGEYLGVLDDAIQLNKRLIAEIEEFGATLLRQAFPAEILQVDGGSTDGWIVETLEVVCATIESGSRPKGGVGMYSSGVPSIGAESINGLASFDFGSVKYVPRDYFDSMTRGRVHSGDVLVYKDGGTPGNFLPRVGMLGRGFPFDEMCINEHVFRVAPKRPLTSGYLYFWLASPRMIAEMRRAGTGAAIPGINRTSFGALPIAHAADASSLRLYQKLDKLVTSALDIASEIRELMKVHATLLPLMLTGKVRVSRSKS